MKLYSQKLIIASDEATGEIGFVPDLCPTFNSTWNNPLMVFHDIFEHWFEHTHPYFRGECAENIIGEMVAMGAMWYFYDNLGFSKRINNHSHYSPGRKMILTTEGLILDIISYGGYTDFGDTLNSSIPYQRPVYNTELEYQIKEMWNSIKKAPLTDDEQEQERVKRYRDSITFAKIANAHRFGYNLAKKIIPHNRHNINLLYKFWEYWEKFFKYNSDVELYQNMEFEFVISKNSGKVNWKLYIDNIKVSTNNPPILEEILYKEEAYY